jgi:hypothetical protein
MDQVLEEALMVVVPVSPLPPPSDLTVGIEDRVRH